MLFPKFHILLGNFGGKFLFSASNFWAKVFAILWALFHSKHLVTLARDCSKVEVMLINALNCFRIVRRREELHPNFPYPGHVGRLPAELRPVPGVLHGAGHPRERSRPDPRGGDQGQAGHYG